MVRLGLAGPMGPVKRWATEGTAVRNVDIQPEFGLCDANLFEISLTRLWRSLLAKEDDDEAWRIEPIDEVQSTTTTALSALAILPSLSLSLRNWLRDDRHRAAAAIWF